MLPQLTFRYPPHIYAESSSAGDYGSYVGEVEKIFADHLTPAEDGLHWAGLICISLCAEGFAFSTLTGHVLVGSAFLSACLAGIIWRSASQAPASMVQARHRPLAGLGRPFAAPARPAIGGGGRRHHFLRWIYDANLVVLTPPCAFGRIPSPVERSIHTGANGYRRFVLSRRHLVAQSTEESRRHSATSSCASRNSYPHKQVAGHSFSGVLCLLQGTGPTTWP